MIINAVGNGTGYDTIGSEAVGFRSTSVAKSFEASGYIPADNAYGTDRKRRLKGVVSRTSPMILFKRPNPPGAVPENGRWLT